MPTEQIEALGCFGNMFFTLPWISDDETLQLYIGGGQNDEGKTMNKLKI